MEIVVGLVIDAMSNTAHSSWSNGQLEKYIVRQIKATVLHRHKIFVCINAHEANIYEGHRLDKKHGHIVIDRASMIIVCWRCYGAPRGLQNHNPATTITHAALVAAD